MPHLPHVVALLLIPIFATADRWVGRGNQGRALPMAFAIVVGGLVGFLTIGTPFALVGALWAAWRSTGFFHNSLAPATNADRAATVLRYALQIPIAVLAYWDHGQWACLAAWLALSAALGIGLRIDFGCLVADARKAGEQLPGDFNALIEKTTGAAFGLALAAYAISGTIA